MIYGQHLVTTLVCFVKAEEGKGASVREALVLGGFCPGGAFAGGSRPGDLCPGDLCPTPASDWMQ